MASIACNGYGELVRFKNVNQRTNLHCKMLNNCLGKKHLRCAVNK